MDIMWSVTLPALLVLLIVNGGDTAEHEVTYIVHMDKSAMPNVFATHHHWYKSLLSSVKGGRSAEREEDLYVYIYDNIIHGFSAKLTQSEVDILEELPGHVLSFPDSSGRFHTTHTPQFLGLDSQSGLWPQSRFGQDVIVGVLDSGIWPESASFLDHGLEPVPGRWKGTCENGVAFNSSVCNRKLIGARSFKKGYVAMYGNIDPVNDYDSARDFFGHGSHTSSTAAGNSVENVGLFGYARGSARGVAPAARIAMYKIGWSMDIVGSDVLAGMDSAISDGADVLSLSFGFGYAPYFQNSIALGAFAAIKKGVMVVCSAGNGGPFRRTVDNAAPWIFNVGGGTIDRDYTAALKLGNGSIVVKASSFFLDEGNTSARISQAPLLHQSGDPACTKKMDPATVRGKVVLCINNTSDSLVHALLDGGALALISVAHTDMVFVFPASDFPVLKLRPEEGATVLSYASSVPSPVVADITFGGTVIGDVVHAPAVYDFSSRGPAVESPNILKPDIIAPGVNILAAWADNETPYNVISGTSMACPHVAGISALVKAVHKDWSPAAIRSALMTTSYTLDNSNTTMIDMAGVVATPLEFGAGHVDPGKALDPGLIYDINPEDYANFLCNLNYTSTQIQIITGTPVSCPTEDLHHLGSDALNYPSFTAIFNKTAASHPGKLFKRTLTNVADDGPYYYTAVVDAPKGLNVQVIPSALEFNERTQKLNFTVSVEVAEEGLADIGEEKYNARHGFLSWIDQGGRHVVKSPVVALFA